MWFGICKKGNTSTQYKPKLYLDNALLPSVKLDDCFNYLDLHFDIEMADDELPPYPKNKLKLYQQSTLSKISWHLTVTEIWNTWMKSNIDNTVSRHIRLWLEIPVNGTLNIVTQSKWKFGLGVTLSSTRNTQCQVVFRNKLGKCSNHNIREIHKSTRNINIQYYQFNSNRKASKLIRWSNVSFIMGKLATQSLAAKSIIDGPL